ncbi:MAG TPA: efflux RND transporter periplasmic adaptor subunit [Bryobacteraceae bacterium]|jgi:RND family efflux transporter MFP subunit
MAANPQTEPEFTTVASHAPARKKSHAGFFLLILVIVLALAGAIAYELSQRKTQEQALATAAADTAGSGTPVVEVARVRTAPSGATVEIPGQTVALLETPLYARTEGYIRQRTVDMGDRVKKGQLLVELDTPDLDQQIVQARATLAQSNAALAQVQASLQASQSTLNLARLTAQRYHTLADQGVMSKQDNDTAAAALESGQANVHAAEESVHAQQSTIAANEANLNRLLEQKKYARMEAPFDGVITYRNQMASDPGTLISSGSGSAVPEILRVSQIQTLRIFVDVPQSYAPAIRVDQPADLIVDEFAGRVFPARVKSTTSSVDPNSRTMLTVLQVDNSDGALLPGMYAKVRFHLPHTINVLRLPAEALLFRTEGAFAAVVGDDRKVHLHKLTLGRDYGPEVEILSGLVAGDAVVLNPTDTIHEDLLVEPKERAEK